MPRPRLQLVIALVLGLAVLAGALAWRARPLTPEQRVDRLVRLSARGAGEHLQPALAETAAGFAAGLRALGADLTVVLAPSLRALYPDAPDGSARVLSLEPTLQTSALYGAEQSLRAVGVETLVVLPEIARLARPALAEFSPDGHHYPRAGDKVLAMRMMGDAQARGVGKSAPLFFAGDSFAGRMTKFSEKYLQTRTVTRAGSAERIPFQFSQLPDGAVPRGSRVYWIVTSNYLDPATRWAPWTARRPVASGEARLVGRLTRLTPLVAATLTTSPYADALAVHELTREDGSRVLVAGRVMNARQLTPEFYWYEGVRMNASAVDWDTAEARHPELRTMRVIDTVGDPALPLFFVEDFVYF